MAIPTLLYAQKPGFSQLTRREELKLQRCDF